MIRRAETLEERAVLVAYLARKIGATPKDLVGQMPFEVASATRMGRPAGAVLYTNYRGRSIELIAAGERGWLTRANIQAAFAYPFLQLGVWTVLTMVDRANMASRELQRRLGFTELCVIEAGIGKSHDTVMYGMTKDKCYWLRPEPSERREAA